MSEPLTPEREAEIRARIEAATEGPWWSDDSDSCWRLHGVMFRHHGQVMNKQILKAPKHGTPYAEYWPEPADAEFIVHAREDVDALLAEVDRLRAELARPAIEAKRREIRDVLNTSMAEAREDRDHEGEAELGLKLREYEAKWAAEDAGRAE